MLVFPKHPSLCACICIVQNAHHYLLVFVLSKTPITMPYLCFRKHSNHYSFAFVFSKTHITTVLPFSLSHYQLFFKAFVFSSQFSALQGTKIVLCAHWDNDVIFLRSQYLSIDALYIMSSFNCLFFWPTISEDGASLKMIAQDHHDNAISSTTLLLLLFSYPLFLQ